MALAVKRTFGAVAAARRLSLLTVARHFDYHRCDYRRHDEQHYYRTDVAAYPFEHIDASAHTFVTALSALFDSSFVASLYGRTSINMMNASTANAAMTPITFAFPVNSPPN